ncbi:MAG TPA: hypothetical protein VNO23_15285 [Candidatus Binatia bacterium]|nr:hypothetical protein [Candidatus Binatia bacterium]
MTTEALLRRGLERRGDHVVLTLDPAFQGLPETAHGGSVVAALHLLAGGGAPAAVRGRYRRRVPLEVPLEVSLEPRGPVQVGRVRDGSDTVLVEGEVSAANRARRRWGGGAGGRRGADAPAAGVGLLPGLRDAQRARPSGPAALR